MRDNYNVTSNKLFFAYSDLISNPVYRFVHLSIWCNRRYHDLQLYLRGVGWVCKIYRVFGLCHYAYVYKSVFFFCIAFNIRKKLYCDIRFEKEEYSVFVLLGLFGYFPHEHCSIQYNLLNKFILQNMNNIVEAFQTKKI